jgi:hypothetical protein
MSGRPINALELYSRFRNEMSKPDDPFRANEVPVDRGFIAPLATYADGQTELALPAFPLGAIWDGVRSFGAQGFDTPEAIQHNAGAAFDAAGGVVMGGAGVGLAGGLADNAVGSAGGRLRPPSGPWPETAGFDERLGAVRQTFENPNDLYRLPLPWNKATPEDRLPYRHDDLIDGKEATTREVQIRDLLGFQDNAVRDDVRALTNPETRARAGEPTVVRYRGNDQIVDGHNRLLADLLNGADAATVRYIDSLLANSPTGSSVPLLQNALERAQPQGIRAYRGAADGTADIPRNDHFWAAKDPAIAESYATRGGNLPSVAPVDMRFQNPLTVDAMGALYDAIPFEGRRVLSDDLLKQAYNRGHDGLVIRNVYDDADGALPATDVYAATRPGTVYSATTGDLLYSGAPTASSIPLAGETQDTDPALLEYLKLLGIQ